MRAGRPRSKSHLDRSAGVPPARFRLLDHLHDLAALGRIGGNLLEQACPHGTRLGLVAQLQLGQTGEVERILLVGVQSQDVAHHHHDVRGQRLGLLQQHGGVVQAGLHVLGRQLHGLLVGLGRLVGLAQHAPAAAQHRPALGVAGVLLELGGQLRHHGLDLRRLPLHLGDLARAGGIGLVGQAGRAQEDVEAERHQRHQDHHGDGGASAARLRLGLALLGVGGAQHAAADLGAGRLGLVDGQQAALDVAADLGQLVLVDHQVVVGPRGARGGGAQQRRQQEGQGHGHHQDENQPDHSPVSFISLSRRLRSSADSGTGCSGRARRRR